MNCSNCGTFNDVNSKFCISCGSMLNNYNTNNQQVSNISNNNYNNQQTNSVSNNFDNQQIGSITIIRDKKIVGCLIPYDVKVDGYFLGQVLNGQTSQFPLYYGEHTLQVFSGYDSGTIRILVNENQKNLVFKCSLHAGISPEKRLHIDFVNFYN